MSDGSFSVRTLPPEVEAVLRGFRCAEFSTITRDGCPVAVQVSPLWQPAEGRILVTTAIGLPNKAYNARRNRHVSLLFSNPIGSGLDDPPAVLVQGDATVSELTLWDDDLTEFWPWIMARQPMGQLWSGNPVTRWLMDWYYMRLLIHIEPTRVRWWPHLDMSQQPHEVTRT
jgi:hypothetical protein